MIKETADKDPLLFIFTYTFSKFKINTVANPGGGPGAWAPPPLEMIKV